METQNTQQIEVLKPEVIEPKKTVGVPFKRGNPGKLPGTKNRLTRTVKETVLAVFNDIQGDPKVNLKAFAQKYPRDFYQIAAKLIPQEISGRVGVSVETTIKLVFPEGE